MNQTLMNCFLSLRAKESLRNIYIKRTFSNLQVKTNKETKVKEEHDEKIKESTHHAQFPSH